jgi:hypothetical protein
MNAEEQRKDEQLNAIGWELSERYLSGTLDFEAFQMFFHRALAICGPGDDMEMFCHYCWGEGWWDWMARELQAASSHRVA